MGDPQDTARNRQRELAAHVESILEAVDPELERHAYPTRSEELVAQYRATAVDLVNETETLADAFDRLADGYDSFEDAAAAREALTAELRRDERFDEAFTDEPPE